MSYVLRTGLRGAARLERLGQAAAPSTAALLDRVGIQPGWRCLDAGCGIGVVTRAIRERGADCLGLDRDAQFVAWARERGGEYRQGSLETADLEGGYDLVYARYLLSHLDDPRAGMARLAGWLRPGGRLVLEDVDFPGHYCYPPSAAFERYLELYQAVAAQPTLGRRLGGLARELDLEVSHLGLAVSLQGGAVAELTLAQIAPRLLQAGLESRPGLARLIRELRAHRRSGALLSLAPTFQLVASTRP